MKFLVAGAIGALTSSDMGVAQFYDRSDSVFYAGKDLLVDAHGIRLFPGPDFGAQRHEAPRREDGIDPFRWWVGSPRTSPAPSTSW